MHAPEVSDLVRRAIERSGRGGRILALFVVAALGAMVALSGAIALGMMFYQTFLSSIVHASGL